MRQHLRGRAVRLCSLFAAAAAAVAVAAVALPAAANSSPGSAGAAASTAPRKAVAITLINGDKVSVRTSAAGAPQVAVHKAGATDSVLSLRLAGTTYEIPADALPYIGHGLDPSLFSLANLQREEKYGHLPVTVRYTAARPKLPGVKFTRSGRGTATGYLTATSAKVFGAALFRQFVADHARATYGQDGLFAGQVNISLAGVPATRGPVRPAYQMRTLTVLGRNLKGQKDTGDVILVINAANPVIFGLLTDGTNFFYKGVAKFSAPVGTYWAIGDFFSGNGNSFAQRLAVLPQFTVKNATTIRVNERSASSEVAVATPRKSVAQQVSVTFIRSGPHCSSFTYQFSVSGLQLFVSPTTKKPTFCGLHTYTSATMTNPPTYKGTPYAYNLDFQSPDGTIAKQHYVARPADLATVSENFYQAVKSAGGWFAFGGFGPQLGFGFSEVFPLSLPAQQIQYFSAGPDIAWQFQYVAFINDFAGGQFDGYRSLPAGADLTEAWNNYPLHPQPDVQLLSGALGRELPQYASAFRVGNSLSLFESPFSDNYVGHSAETGYFGVPGSVMIDSYKLYQNGTLISHGDPANGIAPAQVSKNASTIRFVLNAGLVGAQYPLSPSSSTIWTWTTRRDPNARVPDSWYCGFTIVRGTVVLVRQCAIQPLLTLNYQVQGMSLTGHTAPGPQQVNVSAGHLQLATSPAITAMTAAFSLNDGQSWQHATVTAAGGGTFHIGFSAPAGTDVTLRVSATDAAGGSITETIVRAYGVSS